MCLRRAYNDGYRYSTIRPANCRYHCCAKLRLPNNLLFCHYLDGALSLHSDLTNLATIRALINIKI